MRNKILIGLLPLLLTACLTGSLFEPTPDPAAAATQTAQEALMISIEQTLTAIPTITPAIMAEGTPISAELPEFTATAIPAPNSSEGETLNPLDGMRLIYIPAGEFLMGSSKYDRDLETNEVPQHSVTLDAYWISRTQVTNAMYNQCVAAGACVYSASHEINPRYLDPAYSDHPVVYVTWQSAVNYCTWSGGRLPTEAEWEKAARGTDGQKFPWGNDSAAAELANAGNVIGDTTPTGQYPDGASPYGVLDMGGNVREWVWDWYDPYYYQYALENNPAGPAEGEKKVLKGASFSDIYRFTRPANRLAHDPTSPGANRGFRCVYQ